MKKLIISILSVITILIVIVWGAIKFYSEKLGPLFIGQQLEANRINSNSFHDKDGIVVVTVGTAMCNLVFDYMELNSQ